MKQQIISNQPWIQDELRTVDLGDQRLNKRMGRLLEELSQHPERSICGATSGHKEMVAAYRFFDHPDIDGPQVLAPHQDATLERIRQHPRVLLVQDTTELDYSTHPALTGAGRLTGDHSQGFYFHPLIALTEERLCLGSVWTKLWARTSEPGQRDTRKERPIEEKESYRWVEGYREACAVARQCPQTQVIAVEDAEADIFEVFTEAAQAAQAAGAHADYIIRAGQDRCTDTAAGKLWATLEASPVLGTVSFLLPRTPRREARPVTVQWHAQQLTLPPPYRPPDQQLSAVTVWAVLAQEVDAPAGAEPVEWLLVTSLPVPDFAAAVQILEWYACRWEVEIYFRVFKQGCQVQRLQLATDERLWLALALYQIITWRILYLTMLGRVTPESDDEHFYSDYKRTNHLAISRPPAQISAQFFRIALHAKDVPDSQDTGTIPPFTAATGLCIWLRGALTPSSRGATCL